MTDRRPAHGRPHTRFARACDRLSRGLAWVYDHTAGVFHYAEDWAEPTDDNGEDISGDLPGLDVQLMGHRFDEWPEPDDGRDIADAIHDIEADECDHEYTPNEAATMEWCQKCDSVRPLDVHLPGETAQPVPPRQVHHQAVLLRDGTLLMKTPGEPPAYDPREIDDTLVSLRPEPRSGASAWGTQLLRHRVAHQPWVLRILTAPIDDVRRALESPDPDMYLWQQSQRRALAATA